MNDAMQVFLLFFAGVFGVGLALIAITALFVVLRFGEELLMNLNRALRRYACRKEIVTEWRDAETMRHARRFYMPTPERVELARRGEALQEPPGQRQ